MQMSRGLGLIVLAGAFLVFGSAARRRRAWPFLDGPVLYDLDGLALFGLNLFIYISFLIGRSAPGSGISRTLAVVQNFAAVMWHAVLLLFMVLGFIACLKKRKEARTCPTRT